MIRTDERKVTKQQKIVNCPIVSLGVLLVGKITRALDRTQNDHLQIN